MRFFVTLTSLLWLFYVNALMAETLQPPKTAAAEIPAEIVGPPKELTPQEQEALKIAAIQTQMSSLLTAIDATSLELATTKRLLAKSRDDLEKQQLEKTRNSLSSLLDEQNLALEEIAIGNLNFKEYEPDSQFEFNWQEDLKDIFRPLLAELKDLTKRPRQIEKLRSEKKYLASNVPLTQSALENIRKVRKDTKSPALAQQLKSIEDRWNKKSLDFQSRLDLISYQLEKELNPDESNKVGFFEALRDFFAGRGLNILMAIIAFLFTFLSFRLLARRVMALSYKRGQEDKIIFFARLFGLFLHVMSIIVGIFAVVAVIYLQGDWIILGLVILILVGGLLALRNSVPQYMEEARLILNIGSVRENERVVYEGIPWRVQSIDMFCNLENPALSGSEIRIPLSEASKLQSRRFSKNEQWFPCRPGDIVQLDDGIFGPVMMQSPEMVQLRVKGGSTKTYSTTAFLHQNPRNLSHGFGIAVIFGLDYALQEKITTEIPKLLCAYLQDAFHRDPLGEHLKELAVEFKEAAASSLNLVIITEFFGEAAGQYYNIERFLQSSAINACNQHGWNIPFNQITVHMQQPA